MVVRWTAQTPLTIALVASLLVALLAVVLIVLDRRRAVPVIEQRSSAPRLVDPTAQPLSTRQSIVAAVTWTVLAALLIGPLWAVWGAIGGLAVVVGRRARLPEITALASMSVVAAVVVVRERRTAPAPGGGWPANFESLHGLGMFAVVAVIVAACCADDGAGDGADDGAEPLETAGSIDGELDTDQYSRPL